MKSIKMKIENIPAILYGIKSNKCFLFLHGKQGCKEEAEDFAKIVVAKGWQVLAIDLPEHGERKGEEDSFNPWCIVPELQSVLSYMQQNWTTLALRANSIGAWFAMQSYSGLEFERCMFVSPILNMKKLIDNMMTWARVSEEKLKSELLIPTDFGETLSWKYYTYAKEHPITRWSCNTYILYAGKDNMTARKTVEAFAEKFQATVTVMENGEHWFHTKEQLEVLDKWIKKCI